MDVEIRKGKSVRLRAYGGEIIERVAVDLRGAMVYVCKVEEYEQAIRESRTPVSIGFRISDITETTLSL